MRRIRTLGVALAILLLALVVVLGFVGARYQPNTSIPSGFEGHHVQVDGIPLRVVQRGTGRDVLLIHGSPGCIEDWASVIDELARSFRVTAYDRPGHGFSGDSGQYSMAYNAAIARKLIAALGLQHVIVAGHSYGGATALALAVRNPPEIDAYVLVDSGAYTPPAQNRDPAFALLAVPAVGMGVAATLGTLLAPRRILAGTRTQFRGHDPPAGFAELRTRIFASPKVVHSIAMEWRGGAAWLAAQSPYYSKVQRPLFILGQADDPFRSATAKRLHREVSGSTLQLLSDTGHYLQVERPREVIAAIAAAASAHAP